MDGQVDGPHSWTSGEYYPPRQGQYLCVYQKSHRHNQNPNDPVETYLCVLFFRLVARHASPGTRYMMALGRSDNKIDPTWEIGGVHGFPVTGKVLYWTKVPELPADAKDILL